jgi:hypothetical protein
LVPEQPKLYAAGGVQGDGLVLGSQPGFRAPGRRGLGTGLGSFVGRVEGVPIGALLDPDCRTVAWFGSRQGELRTVQDLQEAIGEYAVLGSDIRAALEADRTGRPDEPRSPAALGSLQLVASKSSHRAEEPGSPDPSTGRALLELAVMVGLLVVVLILVVIAIFGGAVNL